MLMEKMLLYVLFQLLTKKNALPFLDNTIMLESMVVIILTNCELLDLLLLKKIILQKLVLN